MLSRHETRLWLTWTSETVKSVLQNWLTRSDLQNCTGLAELWTSNEQAQCLCLWPKGRAVKLR